MTTDPEQGAREVEQATQQHEFKVGDKVRLKAGGPEMIVVAVEDYGNQVVCRVMPADPDGPTETHSRASLVPADK